nr:PIN domain-containing protein [Elioraea rosea]
MVLVDTSVWVDHLRHGEAALAALLEAGRVLGHPFVLGELSLGGLRDPDTVLGALAALPQAIVATDAEVLGFIARHGLAGSGIGYLDAHLLAATRLTRDARLWTRDRRLARAAERLSLA